MPYSEQLQHSAQLAWYAVNPEAKEFIDCKQLESALHFMGLNPARKLLKDFCGQAGSSAVFSQSDILHLAATVPTITTENLVEAFSIIDENKDGKLSRTELQRCLTQYGDRMSPSEINSIMALFDADKDNSIDYKEFANGCVAMAELITRLAPASKVKQRHEGKQTRKHPKRRLSPKASSKAKPAKSNADSSDCAIALIRKNDDLSGRQNAAALDASGDTSSAMPTAASEARSPKAKMPALRKPKQPQQDLEPTPVKDGPSQPGSNAVLPSPPGFVQEDGCMRLEPVQPNVIPSTKQAKELRGRFLLESNGAVTSECFACHVQKDCKLTVQLQMQPPKRVQCDAGVYVLTAKSGGGWSLLAASSIAVDQTQVEVAAKAGHQYRIVPYSPGCLLKARGKQPALTKVGSKSGGSYKLSKKVKSAIEQLFQQYDVHGKGGLSRDEYDLLQRRADGEGTDPETWEFMIDNFDSHDGQLTLKGMLSMYTQLLESLEGDAAEFYEVSLANLGFNQQFDLDQACPYQLTIASDTEEAFHNVAPLQPMAVGVDHILAQHGVDANHLVVEVDRHLQLHVFYSSSDHVLVVARNKGDTATMIKLDVTAVNASININTTKPLMVAAAGEPQLLLQAIPADRGEESWQLTVKASKA